MQMRNEIISLLMFLLVICTYFADESKTKFPLRKFLDKYCRKAVLYQEYVICKVESKITPKYKSKIILNTLSIPIDKNLVQFGTINGIYPKNFYRQI